MKDEVTQIHYNILHFKRWQNGMKYCSQTIAKCTLQRWHRSAAEVTCRYLYTDCQQLQLYTLILGARRVFYIALNRLLNENKNMGWNLTEL